MKICLKCIRTIEENIQFASIGKRSIRQSYPISAAWIQNYFYPSRIANEVLLLGIYNILSPKTKKKHAAYTNINKLTKILHTYLELNGTFTTKLYNKCPCSPLNYA